MPVLKNARHERYAQELAKGKSQTEAYALAGYTGDRTAASRLATNVNIVGRVTELKERGAERAELSIETVTRRLIGIADKGEALKDAPGLSVARLAMMDAAKLHGWLRERVEMTGKDGGPIKYDLSTLSDAQLHQLRDILVAAKTPGWDGDANAPAETRRPH
jgi:phage terminase small subunit